MASADIYSVVPRRTKHSFPRQGFTVKKSRSQKPLKRSAPNTATEMVPSYRPGKRSFAVTATPLFEVASVNISNHKFRNSSHIKIYGTIVLIDDVGNEFCIFNCKRHCAKTVRLTHECKESVILQNFELGTARWVRGKSWLLFQLKGILGAKELEIINGHKLINCTGEEVVLYDKEQKIEFNYATVTYRILEFATLANLGIMVNEHASGSACMRICAANKLSDNTLYERVLFDGQLDFDNFIQLPTLAVPAYSTLQIKVQLPDNDVIHFVEFEPNQEHGWPWFEGRIEDMEYPTRVFVNWHSAVSSLPEAGIREWFSGETHTQHHTDWTPTSTRSWARQTYYIQPGLKNFRPTLSYCSFDFLEIFSISVCAYGQRSGGFSPKGFIEWTADSKRGRFTANDSITLTPSDGVVKLLVPDLGSGFRGSYFHIETNLVDDQEQDISLGDVTYGQFSVEKWFHRRICSVFRGQNGFAAVHYTIFEDAVLGKLLFKVVSDIAPNGADCQVHGKIKAWYSNYDYSTDYEKKYYQIALLEKKEDDVVKVAGGNIRLSKSAVAVPKCSSVVVGGSVYVLNGNQQEILKFEKAFSPPEEGDGVVSDVKIVEGSHFSLSLRVEWVLNPFLIEE